MGCKVELQYLNFVMHSYIHSYIFNNIGSVNVVLFWK